MHSNEVIDAYIDARKEGLNYRLAAKKVGVSLSTGWQWSHGTYPKSYEGKYLGYTLDKQIQIRPSNAAKKEIAKKRLEEQGNKNLN